MDKLEEKIKSIQKNLETELNQIKDLKHLDNIRVLFLGKNGIITNLITKLKNFSSEEKRKFGPQINQLKKESEEKINKSKEKIIKTQAKALNLKKQNFDVTAYNPNRKKGSLHLYSKFIEEIENIFISMGYDIFDGPEVESDFYNFTALNIPQNHPARDMYDTFWLNKQDMLMRTHTSTVQIHAMKTKSTPIAGIVTGRAFRHEAVDASHDIMFYQCEGIFIDKNVTLSNLFSVSKKFLQTFFKKENLDIRIRPGFFPFVEPGIEIDMQCPFCTKGCSVCKKTRWIEVFPGGLIHPNVLKAGGINPEEYSGFAFGFGLTRLAMLKYRINDIRYFHSGKYKFLKQF
ncbi:phenylalanine--tRNA ligase subunit alpha [Candidatus Babeliales bacterium]|nr:phenylalanine--tRNA ligase subunit alpha [Candidatus Babeliales bacterium]